MIQEAYDKAMNLLTENREILDEIAKYLYENETITGKEFMKIFRRLKGLPETDEDDPEEKEKKETGETPPDEGTELSEEMFEEDDMPVVGGTIDLVADDEPV